MIIDSSAVKPRMLPQDKRRELNSDRDYVYDRVAPPPESLWERFKDWIAHWLRKIFNSKGGNISLRVLEIIFIIAVAVIILLLLLKTNIRGLFRGKSAAIAIDFSELEENIHHTNFDELIAEAVARGDYRKAVRLHFLKLLKQLSDRGLISWQLNKTNNDYVIELSKGGYSKQFREAARLYEYTWYGDFEVSESRYANIVSTFKNFTFK